MPPVVMAEWSFDNLLTNMKEAAMRWGGMLIAAIGVCLLIWMVIKAAGYFLSSQPGPHHMSPLKILCGFCLGAAMAFGGWSMVSSVAEGVKSSVEIFGETDAFK